MSIKEWTKPLSFKIWENFAADFDELINIEIQNRKSDIWFTEFNNMTIKMRPWTVKIWDDLVWTWWVSKQIFFIDFFKKIHHIKWYNEKVWRLVTDTWTDLWVSFVSNNFFFTPVLLPMMLDWTIPTEYTTPANATNTERVKKDAADWWWASNIWKYLIITDNSPNAQAYRWAFSFILDYDAWTTEYTLSWAWITTVLKAWSKYQIYDTLWEHLEVSNWAEYERFFFWKSDWSMVENTKYVWLSTLWLRLVKWILDTEFLLKQVAYDNSYWTFNKNTLYYTAWALNNPFLYNFTTTLSIPWSISWYINDLFVFKERLIIWWSNYCAYFKWPVTSLTAINSISQTYWIVPNWLADVWIDAYFISTNKNLYSLRENISWTALIPNDEWKTIKNYLKDFNYNVVWWFDWSKMYFYWEKTQWVSWNIVVLDVLFKFWSVYTWLSPSGFIFHEWDTYLSDNNSDTVRKFDSTVETDDWVAIEQKVSLKDITAWVPFNIKSLVDAYLRLDNYAQNLTVWLYMANPWQNTRKNLKEITLTEEEANPTADPMWEWVVWVWVLWWVAVDENIALPIMKKLAFEIDSALLWKIIIKWKDWWAFYLNQLDIELKTEDREYFSSDHTI